VGVRLNLLVGVRSRLLTADSAPAALALWRKKPLDHVIS
jgi:hypothetical protein